MKTVSLLIVSSLFLSNMPKVKEEDSINKVLRYKIEKAQILEIEKSINSRMPIIIVKRD